MVSLGLIHIYWYGFFIVLGILAAIILTVKLAGYYKISKDEILDLSFWLVIGGIIGARIFHLLIEWRYYLENPLDIFKVWQGGLAIHGAIIAGLIIVYLYSKKKKLNAWLIVSLIVPGLALAQAIGRWGNYFNQELFGKPTDLAWGIPISIINRPFQYIAKNYFHPTFIYESLGSLLIFLILLAGHIMIIKKKRQKGLNYKLLTAGYLILYSILRFLTEFIRIDQAYEFAGLRHAQITSLLIILASAGFIVWSKTAEKRKGLEK